MSRTSRTLAALAVGGLLLTGCSQAPNTAALVNGERITETELTSATTMFNDLLPDGMPMASVLDSLVRAELILGIADDFGVEVSDQEVQNLVDAVAAQNGVEPPGELSESGRDAIRYVIAVDALSLHPEAAAIQESFAEAFETGEIYVNPRYGEYDEMGYLNPVAPQWLLSSTSE